MITLVLLNGPSGCCVESGLKGHKTLNRMATWQVPAGEGPGGLDQGRGSGRGARRWSQEVLGRGLKGL